MNDTVHREQLINRLYWRYATKQFDPKRKIGPEDWAALEEALVLTPSSCGLQPWRFVVVTDQATKEKLVAASWGQRQPADCSHLVVFAIRKDIDERYLDTYLDRVTEVRGTPRESLAPLRDMIADTIINGMDAPARNTWAAHQVYIGLGNFLTSAAMLGIDACPMEGIEQARYDEILGLANQGLGAVVAAAAGYRAASDKYATQKKVRFPKEQLFVRI